MVYETVLDEKVYVEKGKLKVLAKESDDGPELVRKVATVDIPPTIIPMKIIMLLMFEQVNEERKVCIICIYGFN